MKTYSDTDKESIVNNICEQMHEGASVKSILKKEGMPNITTFLRWIDANEAFRNQYARAFQLRADALFDEMVEIAYTTEEGIVMKDTPNGIIIEKGDMLGHRRLKVDTLKWAMSKMFPKKYGDKTDITTNGKDINRELTDTEIELRIKRLESLNNDSE
jgi:hypothetical protein